VPREHNWTEKWPVPENLDVWDMLLALDAYLREQVTGTWSNRSTIWDTRGTVSADSLAEAYEEWVSDPTKGTLRHLNAQYGEPSGLRADWHLHGLEDGRSGSLDLTVNGVDPALVRGIGQEALVRAERGGRVSAAPKVAATAEVKAPEPAPAPASATTPAPWYNHAWTVALVTGLVAAVVGVLLTVWLT
jgi:hypothetical protein